MSLRVIFILVALSCFSQGPELEQDLKDDLLGSELKKEKQETALRKKREEAFINKKILYPNTSDFWDIFNQYWLIRNAEKLNWAKNFVDLDIERVISKVFEKMSFKKKYKLLYVENLPGGIRALPGSGREIYFLVDIHFINRNQLLSQDIITLLLEELTLIRKNQGKLPIYEKSGKTLDNSSNQMVFLEEFFSYYDDFIFKKKVNLKEHFEIIKTVNSFILSNNKLNLDYKKLLKRLEADKSFSSYKPGIFLAKGWISGTYK